LVLNPASQPAIVIEDAAAGARWATSRCRWRFELARQLRKAPKMIAQDLAAKLRRYRRYRIRVEAANGYPELLPGAESVRHGGTDGRKRRGR
jgi:arginyl-tRNA synthetase